MKRLIVRGITASALAVLGVACTSPGEDGQVPTFTVDALWPQPLEYPNILGPVAGVAVAPDGNVLVVTRQDGFSSINEINSETGTGSCCSPTMAVLEYTPDGALVREWGGPDMGYPWPERPHGIAIDPEGNVWIGGGLAPGGGGFFGRGRGGGGPPPEPEVDTYILKFSRTGDHLMTIGDEDGEVSNASMTSFGGANDFAFDADANEVFVADGIANRRVAVLDMTTGEIKRSWGAYGTAPSDGALEPYDPTGSPAQQFRDVTCVEIADDLVYVCDQGNDRVQVFEKDGTFVEEVMVAPETRGTGSVTDIAFSPDEAFMYVADGMNERVHILYRPTLEYRTSFGTGGRYPSHFRELWGVATDEAGNVYTVEAGQGRRIQKFMNMGLGPVTAEHQGAVYPEPAQ